MYDDSAKLMNHELPQYFPRRITPENRSQWTQGGMELFSRVLPVPELDERGFMHDGPLGEVERYLTALQSGPCDPWACTAEAGRVGQHVHIGSQGDEGIPL
jgi:hypothetical protein